MEESKFLYQYTKKCTYDRDRFVFHNYTSRKDDKFNLKYFQEAQNRNLYEDINFFRDNENE